MNYLAFQEIFEVSAEMAKVRIDDGSFLFRFRSAAALLDDDPTRGGFQELERQEIYFARPESLNDPMEGLTDAFWDGDEVLWENLFRHYALSLIRYSAEWLLYDSHEIDRAKVGAWFTEGDLPTDSFRAIYREFAAEFCSEIDSSALAVALARPGLPLRRERFTNLLFLVHRSALHHLFRILKKHRLSKIDLPPQKLNTEDAKAMVEAWAKMTLEHPASGMAIEDQLEILSRIANQLNHQLELGMRSRVEDQNRARKWIAIFARFPETYVAAFLRDLHFTQWRVACFSRRCINASMWGTYGNEHRGGALVFRTDLQGDARFFRVRGMVGTGGQGQSLEVRPVRYQERPPALDSFLEIGMLPPAKLEGTWMKSQDGAPSSRLTEISADPRAWHKAHWKKAFELATWKHPDWKHEDEARIIASTALVEDPAPNPLTYELSQLEGIVFGMRMTVDDKIRVAKIIERKCRTEGRFDFRFFQAHYSPQKGEMEVVELELLKLKPTS